MFALLEMLKRSGVFDMLLAKLNNASKTPRQAELVTILLSVIGSVAIGAASISILFVGPVVRKLLQTHNIERTRGSNLMDGIATGLAGIVPYNPVGPQRRQPRDRERRRLGVVLVFGLRAV